MNRCQLSIEIFRGFWETSCHGLLNVGGAHMLGLTINAIATDWECKCASGVGTKFYWLECDRSCFLLCLAFCDMNQFNQWSLEIHEWVILGWWRLQWIIKALARILERLGRKLEWNCGTLNNRQNVPVFICLSFSKRCQSYALWLISLYCKTKMMTPTTHLQQILQPSPPSNSKSQSGCRRSINQNGWKYCAIPAVSDWAQ